MPSISLFAHFSHDTCLSLGFHRMQGASISLIVISSCQIGPSQRNFASQPPHPSPLLVYSVWSCVVAPGRRYCWFKRHEEGRNVLRTNARYCRIRRGISYHPLSGPLGDARRDLGLRWNARSDHQAKPGLAFGCWPAVGGRKRRCFANFFYVRWWLVGGWWHGGNPPVFMPIFPASVLLFARTGEKKVLRRVLRRVLRSPRGFFGS